MLFNFWYYYLILNINHISDEKIIYMCLPSIYMILPDFYCFYYVFIVCMYPCFVRNDEIKLWNQIKSNHYIHPCIVPNADLANIG